jgi:hypothetical protein
MGQCVLTWHSCLVPWLATCCCGRYTDCLASLPHSSGKPVELIYTTDDCKQSVAACLEPLWGRPDKCTLATMHGAHWALSMRAASLTNTHIKLSCHQPTLSTHQLLNASCLYRSTRTRIAAPTLSQSSHSPYSPLPAAPVPTGTTSACQAVALTGTDGGEMRGLAAGITVGLCQHACCSGHNHTGVTHVGGSTSSTDHQSESGRSWY